LKLRLNNTFENKQKEGMKYFTIFMDKYLAEDK